MDGLPVISDAQLPRVVRDGSKADKQAYKAALGFEQVLLGELVKEISPALADGPRGDALQDAMTQALTDAGGIGVAAQLYPTLRRAGQ
jgi:hypothetical protein